MSASSSRATARLLADIGGTNARFAWQAGPGAPIEALTVLPVAGFARLQDALRHYLDTQAPGPVGAAAIAIASPVLGDAVRMTNHDWAFSQRDLQAGLGLRHLRVLNDFTALALALPVLPERHRRQVGGAAADAEGAIGLLGAGTGLGVSGLVPDGRGGWIPLQGEGGHVTLPAQDARERVVVDGMVRRHGHASAERVCSGDGLLDTFRVLCEADGAATHGIDTPAAVVEAALTPRQPQAVAALDVFCALLGTVAGNLALTLGARGGVYIGGGIVPRLGTRFDASAFRARFEGKGRYADYLRPIPVWVITAPESPALMGAARSLDGLD
jgi:glucokinase